MDRHRDDEVFDALHAMGDVESSPLGLDGRYADGRIEPATFIYSHVRRLVPGPFKKAVPRIAVGLLFASLGMVFVRMLTGIETGWLAAVLRVGSVPFGLLCGILFAYLGLRLMFERAPKGEDGRRRGLGEGCLMRGFCAPILLALAVGCFWGFAWAPLADVPAMLHPERTELVEFEVSRTRRHNYTLSGTTGDGESFFSSVDKGFYERFRDAEGESLFLEYLPGSNVVLSASEDPLPS